MRYLLETQKSSKHGIIELLNGFINLRKNRDNYEGACERWREDIDFISNYQLSIQEPVTGLSLHQAGKIKKS